jgi:hypothetical protein
VACHGNIISPILKLRKGTLLFALHVQSYYIPIISRCMTNKSKANNVAGCWLYESLQPTSQPTHTVVTSLQLIHSPLVSLIEFLCFCVQAGCKLTTRFSTLSFTSVFSLLIAHYYTCSNGDTIFHLKLLIWLVIDDVAMVPIPSSRTGLVGDMKILSSILGLVAREKVDQTFVCAP